MSFRPYIKQADGTLVDLPLDAETVKGKALGSLAFLSEVPLATTGANGGVRIGFTESGANLALKLSSNKAYVVVNCVCSSGIPFLLVCRGVRRKHINTAV